MTDLRLRGIDAAFVLVLGGLSLTILGPTYDGPRCLVVGIIGLAIGAIVGLLTQSRRISTAIAIGIGAYLLTAGPVVLPQTTIAAVVPSGHTLTGIAEGTVNGWSGILTTEPPVPTTSGALLMPVYLISLAAGLGGVLLARLRLALAPLLPIVGLLSIAILFSTDESQPPAFGAASFIVLVLVWGTLRHRRRVGAARTGASAARQLVTPAILLVVSAVAVAGYDYGVGPVAANERYVLRNEVLPPFDPSAYPSPLSGFRRYEKRDREQVLFTVAGLPPGARLRLATMDAYDGVVWRVVNGDGGPADGSGVFHRMGSRIAPADPNGQQAKVRVTIGVYSDIWLPTAGGVTAISFDGPRGADLAESFRYNTRTSIGVVPAGLGTGDTYTMDVVIPREPVRDELTGLAFGSVTLPELTGVPEEVAVVAGDWVGADGGGAMTPAKLGQIVDTLLHGAFSDGDLEAGVQSPPGHGAKRVRDFLSSPQLVGDDEQYAATLALMARALDVPARVVLGAIPPAEDFDGGVTGEMVSAWVEVYFAGAGWVPLDATPPVESKPKLVHIQPQTDPEGQILEPPVSQAQPPRPVPPPQAEEPIEDLDCVLPWLCFNALPEWAQWTLRYVAPPVLAIAALFVTILASKGLRRRRRRRRGTPVARISGAWQELVDRLRDHGYRSTPYETRRDVAARVGGDATDRLARLADAAVFGPGDPTDASADAIWALVPQAVRDVTLGRSRWQRFVAWINPVSLRPDTRTLAALSAAARARATRRRRPPAPATG